MGFLVLAKHGLKKTWDLRQIWSHFLETKTVERERGERREEEEDEEKKKRREEEGEKFNKQKGMELLNLSMNLWFV